MFRIDGHVHFPGDHPEAVEVIEDLDLLVLNIAIGKESYEWTRRIIHLYRDLSRSHPGRFAWCTAFSPYGIDKPGYADRVIARLDQDIEDGAVACKIWKNVGMEIRDAAGQYVLPDHVAYHPIYRHLEQRGLPLLAHTAEPLACWLPLSNPSPHQGYYSRNPQWHMYGRTGFPSHETILAARDRVMEQYPELRVIGAHLGSMEHDLGAISERLDRYPNFAIDTSARTADLGMHDPEKVREFFIKYSDRIIYGTDVAQHDIFYSEADPGERERRLLAYRKCFETDTAFFESDEILEIKGCRTRGIRLPSDVLQQLYVDNALRWYPVLEKSLGCQSAASVS